MPKQIRARCEAVGEWRSPWCADLRTPTLPVTRYPTWLRALRSVPGVYLVRDAASHTVLYIGRSRTDVKKALVRHFCVWNDDRLGALSPHRRALFDRTKVEVKVYTVRSEWTAATEADLIAFHNPPDNWRRESINATCANREPGEDDTADFDLEDYANEMLLNNLPF